MSLIKPEMSLSASLAVMALDFSIFQMHMPKTADIKSSAPHNQAIDSSRKLATWSAIAASGALSLMVRDPNIFIFGGGFAVALDWYFRHANATNPLTGQVTLPPPGGTAPGGVQAAG